MFKNLICVIFTTLILVTCTSMAYSNTQNSEEYYKKGQEALNEGKYNHAIDYFKESIKANPKYIKAYNKLGITYRILNEIDKAISIYEKSLQIDNNNYEAYHLLSIAYLYKNMNIISFNNAQKFLNLNPENPEAYFGIANVYSAMKDYKKARENYNKALILYKIDNEIEKSDTYTNIALTYYQEKNYKEAISFFGKAIEYNSSNTVAFYYTGLCYFNMEPQNMKLARQNILLAKNLGYTIPDYIIENLGFKDTEKE